MSFAIEHSSWVLLFSDLLFSKKRFFFDTESCYVAQLGLGLAILLPQPPVLGLQVCSTIPG
jgi:hypothetical protein